MQVYQKIDNNLKIIQLISLIFQSELKRNCFNNPIANY